VQQIALRFVRQQNLQDRLENLLVDHILNADVVLSLNYRLEEFDDFDVGLDGVGTGAVRHFEKHLVREEKSAQRIRVHIISNQFVHELQDENATLVHFLAIGGCDFGVDSLARLLRFQLLILHLLINLVSGWLRSLLEL